MTDHGQEERIRELLNQAVSSVEPQYGLDTIRRGTIGAPSRVRRRWLVPAAAALATAAASAVFALLSLSPDRPREGSPAATDPTMTVPVYYLGSTPTGPRLFRELHSVQTGDPALAAVNEALRGRALDPDYYSIWAKIGAEATSVTSMGGEIEVDIATQGNAEVRPRGVSNADASMAVEQLLYTAQEALGLGNDASVQLIVDGRHQATLMGVPISEGLAAGDPLAVQGTVWITAPQDGETIDNGMRIRGRGAFTEANVSWQLLDGLRVVKRGFTMAAECCRLSPFSFVLDAPPGNYTIRVYAADMSGGEGFGEADDTKRITIR
jgi:hypothetical protein